MHTIMEDWVILWKNVHTALISFPFFTIHIEILSNEHLFSPIKLIVIDSIAGNEMVFFSIYHRIAVIWNELYKNDWFYNCFYLKIVSEKIGSHKNRMMQFFFHFDEICWNLLELFGNFLLNLLIWKILGKIMLQINAK